MRAFLMSLFFFISIINHASAIDQASLDKLKNLGFEVRMGEFTGAGSKIGINHLAGLIHPHGVVMKEDCKSITVSKETDASDPKISDITQVVVDQSILKASEFEGFFIRN